MSSLDPIATRDEAYHALEDINDKQQAVLDALRIGPMSDKALAKRLGWTINRVTGRRHELVEAGLVRASYRDVDESTGRSVVIWAVVEDSKCASDHEPAIESQACEGVKN